MNIGAVLIYYIIYTGQHITSGTQEFSEVATCQRAIAELVKLEEQTNNHNLKDRIVVKASCVVK